MKGNLYDKNRRFHSVIVKLIPLNHINGNYHFYRCGEISIQMNDISIKESMTEFATDSCEEFANDLVNSVHEREDASMSEIIEVE